MPSDSRLRSVEQFRVYRRNLPHWESPGNAYFITFSTATGYELTDEAKDIVFAAIKYHADKKYKLFAGVVMKTHVHLVLIPQEESKGSFFSLAQITHGIKSYSANRIQRTLEKFGSVWLSESYDRVIRDEDDYYDIMNYVIFNPVKANIVKNPEDYKWLFYEGSG